MSDLQCPAVFVVLTPATVGACDVSGLRLSLVVCGCEMDAAGRAALQRLAAKDRCEIQTPVLSNHAVFATKISELADSYRGEQVAIVASADVIRAALQLPAAPADPVELAVDSDGWRVHR